MKNRVNHPSYYSKEGRKECIVEMEENFGVEATIIFCLMNSYKYLYRAGNKEDNPEKQDISKANWYFQHANWLMTRFNYHHITGTPLYRTVYMLINEE